MQRSSPLSPCFSPIVVAPSPAFGVTQAAVDEACAESSDAYGVLKAARVERDAAQARYADLISDREQTAYLEARLAGIRSPTVKQRPTRFVIGWLIVPSTCT